MPSAPLCKLLTGVFVWGLLAGCAGRIPPQLAEQISWNLDFPEIRRQPEAYSGRLVALGGIVTQIDAMEDSYRVVVSEVPLDGSSRPRPAVNQLPRGMFVVLIPRHAFLSDLRPGVEITVVGEVRGKSVVPEVAAAAALPLLEARYIRAWRPSWWPHLQLGVWGGISI